MDYTYNVNSVYFERRRGTKITLLAIAQYNNNRLIRLIFTLNSVLGV